MIQEAGNKPRGSIKNFIFLLSERSQWVSWVRNGQWRNISVYPPTSGKTKLWNKHPDFAYSRMMAHKSNMYDFCNTSVRLLFIFYLYAFVCVHRWPYACHSTRVEARVHSLLPPSEFPGSSSACQAWCQVSLPVEPPFWLKYAWFHN